MPKRQRRQTALQTTINFAAQNNRVKNWWAFKILKILGDFSFSPTSQDLAHQNLALLNKDAPRLFVAKSQLVGLLDRPFDLWLFWSGFFWMDFANFIYLLISKCVTSPFNINIIYVHSSKVQWQWKIGYTRKRLMIPINDWILKIGREKRGNKGFRIHHSKFIN